MFKRILKIILIILIIILISLIVNNLREATIIYKYSQKLDEFSNIKNFYAKYEENGNITEYWAKDNRGVTKNVTEEDEMRLLYVDEDWIWILTETKNEQGEMQKEAVKQKNTADKGIFVPDIATYSLYAENRWQSIAIAINSTITDEEVDGEKCYKIYFSDDLIIYVNKETYMNKKEINSGREKILLEYKLNSVSDEDLEILNFLGYKVKSVD